MKKIILAAMAVCAVFASCSKDNGGKSENAPQYLSIKISGATQPGLRAIEDPGVETSETIQLTNGHIFVINPLGVVTYSEELKLSEATSDPGQTLESSVAADSRVYILGNIPSADKVRITALTTIDAIQAAASEMSTQDDYTEAALANSDGPVQITPGADNTAKANVEIKPLISRIELAQVVGGGNITAFTVAGVYVDDYYPSFTYGGSYAGTMFSQGQSEDFTGTIGDAGTWAATGSSPLLVAIPEADKVWAHNVAAGSLPRFIIALTGVKYTKGNATETLEGTHYLTVSGYTGVNTFDRGKIYRIGGEGGIEFDEEDLGLTPNPEDVTMILEVAIVEWDVETPDASL